MTWLTVLTVVHTALSIMALLLGIAAVLRLAFGNDGLPRASLFLGTAAAATLTGFAFPFHGPTPAIGVGLISSIVLIVTYIARAKLPKARQGWRTAYVIGIAVSEYFLWFVAVAQAFTKIPALHVMAPTLKEPPFGFAQAVVLVVFVALAIMTVRRNRRVVTR